MTDFEDYLSQPRPLPYSPPTVTASITVPPNPELRFQRLGDFEYVQGIDGVIFVGDCLERIEALGIALVNGVHVERRRRIHAEADLLDFGPAA